MNWIINTCLYGMKIQYNMPGSETIDWRGDMVIYGRVKLGMGQLSDIFHSLVNQARETLGQLTITAEEGLAVPGFGL